MGRGEGKGEAGDRQGREEGRKVREGNPRVSSHPSMFEILKNTLYHTKDHLA